jgi:hypothetical protein
VLLMPLRSLCKPLSLMAFNSNRIIKASSGILQMQCESGTKSVIAFRIFVSTALINHALLTPAGSFQRNSIQ